jgi:acyl transferase domain-containing protein
MPAGLSIAAINAPELTVVSGPSGAIAQLQQRLAEREVDSVRVRISIAAHSSMLEPILDEFRRFLSGLRFQAPTIPFVSNLTGTWIAPSEAMSADYWVKHLRNTVRFADGIRTICGTNSHVLLEVGPGRTLATLARLHPEVPNGHAVFNSLPHPDEDASDTVVMLNVLGRRWANGVAIDWESLHDHERRRRIPADICIRAGAALDEADPVRPVAEILVPQGATTSGTGSCSPPGGEPRHQPRSLTFQDGPCCFGTRLA